MLKRLLYCTTLSFLSVLPGCQKRGDINNQGAELSLSEARVLFESGKHQAPFNDRGPSARGGSTPRLSVPHEPDWTRARAIGFQGHPALIVPLVYSRPVLFSTSFMPGTAVAADDLSWLLFRRNAAGGKVMEVLHYFPDSAGLSAHRKVASGLIVVEDWARNRIASYYVGQDGVVGKAARVSEAGRPGNHRAALPAQQVCLYANGYNYAADDPTGGYYWSELITCATYIPEPPSSVLAPSGYDYSGGVSTAAGTVSAYRNFVVPGSGKPITDVKSYLACFGIVSSSSYQYQVELCVIQPLPGTRLPWILTDPASNDGNPFDVGHTYLVLTQKTPSGTITRNIGFYPEEQAKPTSPKSPGIMSNDENRYYNIKLTISMSASQFNSILDYIQRTSQPMAQYDLNYYNCTTFAIYAVNSAGFQIPATRGSWYNGGGCNPGDLGEDIRKFPLGDGMSRSYTSTLHNNRGICK